jgi:hypothetical protein
MCSFVLVVCVCIDGVIRVRMLLRRQPKAAGDGVVLHGTTALQWRAQRNTHRQFPVVIVCVCMVGVMVCKDEDGYGEPGGPLLHLL